MTRRKRRIRSRRVPTPTSRPAQPNPTTSIARASNFVTVVGVLAVGCALAVQLHLLPLRLSPHESAALRIAGIGLVIAGFVLGRTRASSR
jgi:hypothetical protein